MNKLNLIIKYWPSNESESTKRKRVMRTAQEMFPEKKISATAELTDDSLRDVVERIPKGTKGLDAANLFINTHYGFPSDEWREMCGEKIAEVKDDALRDRDEEIQRLSNELSLTKHELELMTAEAAAYRSTMDQIVDQGSSLRYKVVKETRDQRMNN